MDHTSEKLRAIEYFLAKVLLSVRIGPHCYSVFPSDTV